MTARLGAPDKDWRALLLAQLRAAVAGGVTAVQVRESGVDAREYAAFLRDCASLTSGTDCKLIVNDRVDLALTTAASGVHLRESSIPTAAARRLAPEKFLVGRSVHDARTAGRERNADYLIAGSVFETASKPGRQATLGLAGLRAVVDAAGECPVWAVGGITQERMQDIRACGVGGVAAIGAFLPPTATTDFERHVQKLTEALRFSLDRRG